LRDLIVLPGKQLIDATRHGLVHVIIDLGIEEASYGLKGDDVPMILECPLGPRVE